MLEIKKVKTEKILNKHPTKVKKAERTKSFKDKVDPNIQ